MAFIPANPGFGGFALDPQSGALNLGASGATANPGGGQAGGLPITSLITRVTTVGTAGDSVLLPVSNPGTVLTVINQAALSLNVFPQPGDNINALGANTAFALATTKVATFFCAAKGQWNTILTA